MLVTEERLLDSAGRPRSPATMPGYHAGRPPRNKGIRYPADPPRVEEIVSVMRQAGPGIHGARLPGLIVVLWRAGLRISEGLCLAERDLDPVRGALLVRNGKGGKRREVGMESGAGSSFARGSTALGCRSARSSASSTGRLAGARGLGRPHEHSFGGSPSTPE
jgi:hypothetical protein